VVSEDGEDIVRERLQPGESKGVVPFGMSEEVRENAAQRA